MSERRGRAGRGRRFLRRKRGSTGAAPVPERRQDPVVPRVSLSRQAGAPAPDPDQEDTVRIATGEFRRRRRAGRWRVVRRVAALVLVLAVLCGAGWLVFFSDYVTAERVEITGADSIPAVRVRRAADVPTGTPLARIDLDRVRARVEAIPAVRSVEVSRGWPHAVRINVEERQPVGVIDHSGTLQALDAQGVLFGSYGSRPRGLPLVEAGDDASSEALTEAGRVLASLPARLLRRVDSVRVTTVDDVRLVLRGGPQVLWGSAESSTQKAEVLGAMMHHAARGVQEVDVSVPGRPTTR